MKESCNVFIQDRTLKPTVVCLKLFGPEVAREMARLERRRVGRMARIRTRPSVMGLYLRLPKDSQSSNQLSRTSLLCADLRDLGAEQVEAGWLNPGKETRQPLLLGSLETWEHI